MEEIGFFAQLQHDINILDLKNLNKFQKDRIIQSLQEALTMKNNS